MTLKEQRDRKIARQQEIVNNAKTAGRELSDEERREFDLLQSEVENLQRDIDQANTRTAVTGDDHGEEMRRAVEEERKRNADIMSLCREFNLEPGEYISSGAAMDQVRSAVLERLKSTNAPVSMAVTRDEGDKFRDAATDALLMRAGIQPEGRPADGANDFRNLGLRNLAIECLSREGFNSMELLRKGPDDLYNDLCRQFFNPTAAFPAILDNTIQKSIVHLYNSVPTTFQQWTTKGSLSDFKETKDHEYVIGGMGDFLKVPENGELKADKPRTELMPNRKLDTYGKSFSMSRQAFINDDIGFMTEMPGLYASRAKKTIDKQVYSLLYNNQKIFDGSPLFDGKHNNVMTNAGKPSQMTLQAMILQMQKQKDQFGEAIYMTPQHIIVPVGYEFELAVLFRTAGVTGSANNDINPLYNYPINVVQTPVLNVLANDKAVPWFMVADTASARGIQVDYLNGNEMPTIRRMEAPGILGYTWDIYLDWGIAVRDYRGIVKNPGEVIV